MNNTKIGVKIAIGIIVTIALIWIISAAVNDKPLVERVDVPTIKEEPAEPGKHLHWTVAEYYEFRNKYGREHNREQLAKLEGRIITITGRLEVFEYGGLELSDVHRDDVWWVNMDFSEHVNIPGHQPIDRKEFWDEGNVLQEVFSFTGIHDGTRIMVPAKPI